MPGSASGSASDSASGSGSGSGFGDRSGQAGLAWGPARWISAVTLLAMLAALAWRLVDHDPENRVVAAVLVAVFAVVTLLLVRIRVRLRVVPGGIAVTGPLHTRRIDWSQIDTISTARRGRPGRRGRRTTMLELDVRRPAGAADGAPGGTPVEVGHRGDVARPPGDVARPTAPSGDPRADDELLAFGRFELGTDPAEVGRTLLRLRP